MSAPRVALVTRHFWPASGPVEITLGRLAAELVRCGAAVTVLTPCWDKTWPAQIDHRGAQVVRLPPPGRGLWANRFYGRRLIEWLAARRGLIDVACVSGLKHDACAILARAGQLHLPVVLRAETAGRGGDCHWQLDARGGKRIKRQTLRAPAIVAPTRAVERELHAAGFPRERVHFIAHGVPIGPPSSPESRRAARAALAEADSELMLADDAPLAVYLGMLADRQAVGLLLSAWRLLGERRHDARLWLIGAQGNLQQLNEQIRAANLLGRVRVSGEFDDLEDVLQAANVLVAPSAIEDASLAIQQAMGCALPAVAADSPAHRELIGENRFGRLVPPKSPQALADALADLFDRPQLASMLGEAARAHAAEAFSLKQMALRHLDLFATLTHGSRAGGT